MCVNGGWMHPQCTRDLCHLSRDEIDEIDRWYCEDCIDKDKEIEQCQIERPPQQQLPPKKEQPTHNQAPELKNQEPIFIPKHSQMSSQRNYGHEIMNQERLSQGIAYKRQKIENENIVTSPQKPTFLKTN